MFNIFRYFHNRYAKFIHCDREHSTIMISRSLWSKILDDQKICDSLRQTSYDVSPSAIQPDTTSANAPTSIGAEAPSDGIADATAVSGFSVVFTKVTNPVLLKVEGHSPRRPHYAFFVNPVWKLHGVDNPKRIQAIPITKSKQGHIGFQSVQPTVDEIATIYGIPDDQKIFDIPVKRFAINAEPYYSLER